MWLRLLSYSVLIATLIGVMISLTAACSTIKILTGTSGTVLNPTNEFGLGYPNNLDHCWLIRISGSKSVSIKFSRFEVESCCDIVSIYLNSEVPDNSSEVFRLTEAGVVHFEFLLPGKALVRFKTDGSVLYNGFEFSYRLVDLFTAPETGVPVTAEVITIDGAAQGYIVSHLNFGSKNYANNQNSVWVIKTDSNRVVALAFEAFQTESGADSLIIYQGTRRMNILSGVHSQRTVLLFVGTVTMVFRSNSVITDAGFKIKFIIGRAPAEVESVKPWSGKAVQIADSLKIMMYPLAYLGQTCQLHLTCKPAPTFVQLRNFTIRKATAYALSPTSEIQPDFCVDKIICEAALYGTESAILRSNQILKLPLAYPESVNIEFINQDLWNLTRMIQFRALSDSACPSVRHTCELRMLNRSSLPAQQVEFVVSPSSQTGCLSSVMTQFAVSLSPSEMLSTNSVVACRLVSGSFVESRVPLISFSKNSESSRKRVADTSQPTKMKNFSANHTKHGLIIGAFATAGLAIAALILVSCRLRTRTIRPPEATAVTVISGDEYCDDEYTYPRSMSFMKSEQYVM